MMRAVGMTVDTAGRTVLYSGLIFAIATVGLLVFESPIIRAIAVGAASVVVIAILTALILIPALLGYFGEKLIRPGALSLIPGVGRLLSRFGDIAPAEGAFSRLTGWVQRRPVLVSAACLLVLLAVGSPLLTLNITSNAADTIPRSSTQYTYLHELRSDFPNAAAPRVQLVSDGTAAEAAGLGRPGERPRPRQPGHARPGGERALDLPGERGRAHGNPGGAGISEPTGPTCRTGSAARMRPRSTSPTRC